ncbi:tyrosinase family oxidase copper chaperone [Streptomyces sp. NBC_00239]|uniref:tyrosinase family oxidase copper chaperone n=1 Tax=Streptomyces sp. NBC_00239 TaxID=2903640 RepID=UPI002E2DF270|nr:tyrosinase family oxidase copper chaperone [Streptomyces sp. NBC_00239]
MNQHPSRWTPRGAIPRRAALRTAFTLAVASATAAALAPVLRARRAPAAAAPVPRPAPGAPETLFEEMYRGRHISAFRGTGGGRPRVDVLIDGRRLHVMRRADGSYLSGVNHFESFDNPLDLARAAVDEIGTVRLAAAPAHHG